MKIALVSLLVNDPLAAYKFYTEVLGFISKVYMPESYVAIIASPEDPDGTTLLLEPNDNPISKPFHEAVYNAGLPIIVFGVQNVQAEYEKLTAKGVMFTQPPTTNEMGTTAVFNDTCGNLIQISQP